jgi:D-serine deaminase-like pyridoxal phosphate-dependent protein
MGYDAHVGKLPPIVESREESHRKSVAQYEAFIAAGRERLPALFEKPDLTFNGAGSMTLALHRGHTACNDLAAGSCLLKPSDFDLPTLEDFEPAAFIATPVLKRLDGVQLPGAEWASKPMAAWDRNRKQSFFIYGGLWKARYHAPAGLRDNTLYGGSSNQHMVNASTRVDLHVDDQVFLRPTQSEAVLLEFGPLWVHRGGRFVEAWPPLNQNDP